MKNILKTIGLVFGLGLFMQACDDWTMPEANIIQNLDGTPKSEEYYRKLRAYKKTDHQIAFGWFGFWNGGTSTSARGSLRSAPDSMDIISIWGDKYNLTQNHIGTGGIWNKNHIHAFLSQYVQLIQRRSMSV